MWTTRAGKPFIVIAEDIHATRLVLRTGKHMSAGADGRPALKFTDEHGEERLLPIPPSIVNGTDFSNGRVKQVQAAIAVAMDGRDDAEAGTAYLRSLVVRQERGGADYLDLNVDEMSIDAGAQQAVMCWLVEFVESVATVPVALDSSSAGVLSAGLGASRRSAGALLLNSASMERPDVLDLAAREGCPVVLSAAGATMPADADERVANARQIIEAALACGLDLSQMHVDPLVLPVAVDPDAGRHFLDAVSRLRAEWGEELHITGGFSNVSFGMPGRPAINEAFTVLASDAGADSGILDPIGAGASKLTAVDRTRAAWTLAADLLTGADPFGGNYLVAYRAGELA